MQDERIERFYRDAKAYCDYIDSVGEEKPAQFYGTVMGLLSALAGTVSSLPPGEASRKDYDEFRLKTEERQKVSRKIDRITSADCAELGEVLKEDQCLSDSAFMLFDALADIYGDLKNGVRLYELGTEDAIAAANWEWRFNYEIHWGEHLYRALQVLVNIHFTPLMME